MHHCFIVNQIIYYFNLLKIICLTKTPVAAFFLNQAANVVRAIISCFTTGARSLKYTVYPETRTIRFGYKSGLSYAYFNSSGSSTLI